ncbi:hypothetical protein KSD_82630 [Ktedonobacter sp. SOSP1-85]|nr:hypothetical protein KSD_82630 [Ktedonobacter sp. SOSP1-85]
MVEVEREWKWVQGSGSGAKETLLDRRPQPFSRRTEQIGERLHGVRWPNCASPESQLLDMPLAG